MDMDVRYDRKIIQSLIMTNQKFFEDLSLEIYEKIISKSLSVRETELLVKKSKKVVPIEKTKTIKSEFYEDIAKELKNYFNTSVFIKASGKGKGVIQIPFNSNKDLNDFIKKLKRED